MKWFFETIEQKAERIQEQERGRQLLADARAKEEKVRRLSQLDSDLSELLDRAHQPQMLGLSAFLANDAFFGLDRRQLGTYSFAKERILRIIKDEFEKKAKQNGIPIVYGEDKKRRKR